jgi:hypothetical protein
MAKKLLTSYTFTPGVANAGTVVVSGTYTLEQFLLITNVSTGATIYQFNKPSKGGTVTTGGGNTTLTLEADTSAMSGSDRLQVFVDDGQNIQVSLTNASVEISNDVGNAVPVSAAALPLPAGAATETTLSSVDSKLPALDTGSIPVLVKNGQLEIQNDIGNPIPVGPAAQTVITGSASANNTDLLSTACDQFRSACFQITGTWTGTISFQVSLDGTNWVALACSNSASLSGTFAASATSNAIFAASLAGYQFFRLRFTAYTSGTASAITEFNREGYSQSLPATAPTNTVVGSATASGTTLYTVNSAASTNAANIKSTAANFYGMSAMNTSATTKYVRFYSKATTPTVGTDVPIMVVAIPATSSKEIEYIPALRFGTGLAVAITGGAAATDSTAVAAGDVQLLVSYA